MKFLKRKLYIDINKFNKIKNINTKIYKIIMFQLMKF